MGVTNPAYERKLERQRKMRSLLLAECKDYGHSFVKSGPDPITGTDMELLWYHGRFFAPCSKCGCFFELAPTAVQRLA